MSLVLELSLTVLVSQSVLTLATSDRRDTQLLRRELGSELTRIIDHRHILGPWQCLYISKLQQSQLLWLHQHKLQATNQDLSHRLILPHLISLDAGINESEMRKFFKENTPKILYPGCQTVTSDDKHLKLRKKGSPSASYKEKAERLKTEGNN